VKKTTRLKRLIQSPELSFLMEAHNGLSAKIVEEAGFEGIWASGLSISASLGVRDNNEASWTQVLEVAEFMSDATSIPILLDGDTGYGNFNTMRRVVRKLEQRGVAGVCIEDKIFPKTNSFIRGTAQPLVDVEEFCGKIKAGKDAQSDDDFVIVARVEAFIAGWGLEEALKRAEAYRLAGADAILMHSALRSPTEILAFKREWGDRLPVVIVPTKYYTTPTEVFREHGISVVIWANHLMRTALTAMRRTAQQIAKDQHLLNVEDRIVSVAEVFRIQGEDELEQAEKLYLPKAANQAKALILAASQGKELGSLTQDRPKCMVEIAGRPILAHIADTFRAAGIKDISAVRGSRKEQVNLTGIRYFDNDEFATTQEAWSLYQARSVLEGDCVIAYGDVLFKKHLPQQLLDAEADFVVPVDPNWQESRNRARLADYVLCSEPCSRSSFYNRVTLKDVTCDASSEGIHGEWMGFLRVTPKGAEILTALLERLAADPEGLKVLKMPDLLKFLMREGHEIQVVYTTNWLDIDTVDDALFASNFEAPVESRESRVWASKAPSGGLEGEGR
jgi:phosphoenolpyruvate phosphomutase